MTAPMHTREGLLARAKDALFNIARIHGYKLNDVELSEAARAVTRAIGWSAGDAQSSWQPIETAPKDGTLIEVKGMDGPYGVTSFEALARWSTPTNWHKDQSNWTSPAGAVLALAGYKPSHWRPRGSVVTSTMPSTTENKGE